MLKCQLAKTCSLTSSLNCQFQGTEKPTSQFTQTANPCDLTPNTHLYHLITLRTCNCTILPAAPFHFCNFISPPTHHLNQFKPSTLSCTQPHLSCRPSCTCQNSTTLHCNINFNSYHSNTCNQLHLCPGLIHNSYSPCQCLTAATTHSSSTAQTSPFP